MTGLEEENYYESHFHFLLNEKGEIEWTLKGE
jgi:hypothetical protein